MDQRQELRHLLATRQARITPEQVGLPASGASARRVPGRRRSELALLANVSVEYLTTLERGNATGVSDAVLEAVGQALQRDAAESSHLFDLARGAPLITFTAEPDSTSAEAVGFLASWASAAQAEASGVSEDVHRGA